MQIRPNGNARPVHWVRANSHQLPVKYKGYTISLNPFQYTPDTMYDWVHDDYDGAPDPDSNEVDTRGGSAATVEDAMREIDADIEWQKELLREKQLKRQKGTAPKI